MKSPQSPNNPFEELYDKPLTAEELKEMRHNLVGYVQLLIKLDRQYKAWLSKRNEHSQGTTKSPNSDIPPEVIH